MPFIIDQIAELRNCINGAWSLRQSYWIQYINTYSYLHIHSFGIFLLGILFLLSLVTFVSYMSICIFCIYFIEQTHKFKSMLLPLPLHGQKFKCWVTWTYFKFPLYFCHYLYIYVGNKVKCWLTLLSLKLFR